MVCFCLHLDKMFVVLSNASHNTDSYNSDLTYTLCTVGLPSTMHYIMLILFFQFLTKAYTRWILFVSHHHACAHIETWLTNIVVCPLRMQ